MRAALLQITSSDDPAANARMVDAMIAQAADGGADLVLTPEVTNCVSSNRARQLEVLQSEAEDQTLALLRERAAKAGIWLSIGSLALKTEDTDGRFANRSFLIGPDGAIVARYDKIHMFDVQVTEAETYRESAGYRPGTAAVVADTALGRIGLTVCYDVRFPHLYRALGQAGAQILTVPAAFSPATGPGHWDVLLRARAIETGAYILAPAQCGTHAKSTPGGRKRASYGHSLAIDPWGKVLLDAGTEPGISFVDLDLDRVADTRAKLPSLFADAPYDPPV